MPHLSLIALEISRRIEKFPQKKNALAESYKTGVSEAGWTQHQLKQHKKDVRREKIVK